MRRRILNVELSTRPTKGFSPGRAPILNADLNRVRRSGSGSVTACTRASTVVLLADAWSRVLYNIVISARYGRRTSSTRRSRAPGQRVVRRTRLRFAESLGRQSRRDDTVTRDERLLDGRCPALRQLLVEVIRQQTVGVAFDAQLPVGVTLEHLGDDQHRARR